MVTGRPSLVGEEALLRLVTPESDLAVSSDGSRVYATDGSGLAVFLRNQKNGRLMIEQLLPLLARRDSIAAFTASNDGRSLYAIQRGSGMPDVLAVYGLGARATAFDLIETHELPARLIRSLTVSPDGNSLYGLTSRGVVRFDRDSDTGGLSGMSNVGPSPLGTSLTFLYVSRDSRHAYVADSSRLISSLIVLERTATGDLVERQRLEDDVDGSSWIVGTPNGELLFVARPFDNLVAVFRRDPAAAS